MEDNALRAKNLETIHAFLACRGPERHKGRAPLFTADATKEMYHPDMDKLTKNPAGEWLVESSAMVPEWGFYENQIFQTSDPNLFLVKSIGRGNALFSGEKEVYINYYINEFLMEDGKIKRFRETVNPCAKYHR